MNPDVLTVRQWQKLYQAGTFAADDCDARELAGWSDFSDPLTDRRVHSLSKLVLGITHPFILTITVSFFQMGSPTQVRNMAASAFTPWAKSDSSACSASIWIIPMPGKNGPSSPGDMARVNMNSSAGTSAA